jgi:TolB-like protein/tetratricopeptide (TPR) repeat protein
MPDKMSPSSPGGEDPGGTEVADLLASLDTLALDHFSVVGPYVRFEDSTRHALKDLKQRILASLQSQSAYPTNFLLWGSPGAGKSYLIQQIARVAGPLVGFRELNLAQLDREAFLAGLEELTALPHPVLCLLDEIDAKPTEPWPYEVLLPFLEPTTPRPYPLVCCLAGSGGEQLAAMREHIRSRPKGHDLLSRVGRGNEVTVDPLGAGDRILVLVTQLLQASREEGKEIHEIEKFALYYVATHPSLASARQLRSLAIQCAQRVPVGEDRIRYDYLFSAGDPENKDFWARSTRERAPLLNAFIHVDLGTGLGPGSRPLAAPASVPSPPDPPAADPRRLVVLPFTNISPEPNEEYLADGMTEELIGKLARVPGLRVIARTTSMHFKGRQETALEIGRTLKVGTVAECSLRKAGNRLRITAQLIDTTTEEPIWSGRYDRVLDDIFAIQDDIAGEIARAISNHLSDRGERPKMPHLSPGTDTRDLAAYTDYLHGRKSLGEQRSVETVRRALSYFERAAARDPAFGRARVGIADCWFWLGNEGAEPTEHSFGRAQEELAAVLRLNEGLAEAHSSLALLHLARDEFPAAETEARRAMALNPNLSGPYRTLFQVVAGNGQIQEAVTLLERALQVDPLDVTVISLLGRIYWYAGREADALQYWRQSEALAPFRTASHRTEYFLSQGDLEAADHTLGQMRSQAPENVWTVGFQGVLCARRGDVQGARESISKLQAMAEKARNAVFLEGYVHLYLGELDRFFASMDRAQELHALPYIELLYSPLLDAVRKDPRFVRLRTNQSRLRAR